MYESFADPYCYPGTVVLKNIRDIRNPDELEAVELNMTRQRAKEPLPPGRLTETHYCAIHRHLFQDVYAWAGRFRTVRLAKGSSAFCYPEHIDGEMRKLFAKLKGEQALRGLPKPDFARAAAAFLATLNAIHPFREGNGRTQLTFLTLLADRAGHPFDLVRLQPRAFLAASVASFKGDENALVRQIARLIR